MLDVTRAYECALMPVCTCVCLNDVLLISATMFGLNQCHLAVADFLRWCCTRKTNTSFKKKTTFATDTIAANLLKWKVQINCLHSNSLDNRVSIRSWSHFFFHIKRWIGAFVAFIVFFLLFKEQKLLRIFRLKKKKIFHFYVISHFETAFFYHFLYISEFFLFSSPWIQLKEVRLRSTEFCVSSHERKNINKNRIFFHIFHFISLFFLFVLLLMHIWNRSAFKWMDV